MIPTVSANGASIPALGLGTWPLKDDHCIETVAEALAMGYRHIDTAAMYENERAVGEGVRAAGVPRDEIFLTTKVWYTDLTNGALQRSAEASLRRLGLEAVDLLLIHWPSQEIPLAEQVGALCDAKRRGLTNHIGVSNFPSRMVDEAVKLADEPLVTNQVEYHPYLDQAAVLAACRRHGLSLTSYMPIGRGKPFAEPAIVEIANAHGKTPAQVVLRWQVQQDGVIAIPKSGRQEGLRENAAIFDFALGDDEMARISALARADGRMVSFDFAPEWD